MGENLLFLEDTDDLSPTRKRSESVKAFDQPALPRIPTAVPGSRKTPLSKAGALSSSLKLHSIGSRPASDDQQRPQTRQVAFEQALPAAAGLARSSSQEVGAAAVAPRPVQTPSTGLRRSQSETVTTRPLLSRLQSRGRSVKYHAKYEQSTVLLLAEYFKGMDDDNDGRVSQEDFKRAYELRARISDIHGLPDNWSEADGYYELLDTKHLGFITFLDVLNANFPLATKRDISEMMQLAYPRPPPIAPTSELTEAQRQEIVDIFALLDTDGSGTISVAELKTYLAKMGFYSRDEVRQLITSMDGDGDGTISLVEFMNGMTTKDVFSRGRTR